jgi:hypothetical protein
MKNFIKKLVLCLMLVNLGLTMQMIVANAETPVSDPKIPSPIESLQNIGKDTKLPNYVDTGIHPDASTETKPGVATISSPIYFALDLFRYLISGIAFIYIIVYAFKLTSTANDDEAVKVKDGLIMAVLGFILIQIADVAVKKVFFGEQGEAFQDVATTKLYAAEAVNQMRGLIGFFEYFLGAVAVLFIIIKGFTLITSAGNEEEIGKAKKQVLYALAGLIVVGLSEVVVRGFIFPENGAKLPDTQVGLYIIVSVTNFLVGFIAIASFLMLVYGGYSYVVSGGNEEVKDKVKKIIFGAVMALLISMGAFAAVNTFVKFDSPENASSSTSPAPLPTKAP